MSQKPTLSAVKRSKQPPSFLSLLSQRWKQPNSLPKRKERTIGKEIKVTKDRKGRTEIRERKKGKVMKKRKAKKTKKKRKERKTRKGREVRKRRRETRIQKRKRKEL